MNSKGIAMVAAVLLVTSTVLSAPTWSPYSPYTGYQGNIDEICFGSPWYNEIYGNCFSEAIDYLYQ